MTMDAVSATIVLGGQAILLKYRGWWKWINIYFNLSVTTVFLQPVPSPNYPPGRPHIGSCGLIKSLLLEGRAAPPPWSQCFWQFVVCSEWSCDDASSPYVKIGTKLTLRRGWRCKFLSYVCMHHTTCIQIHFRISIFSLGLPNFPFSEKLGGSIANNIPPTI